MPLYDFRCTSCDETFEAFVFSSTASATCPACTSEGVERLITGFAGVGARNAPEPTWSSTPAAHRHSAGCGCGHAH